MLQVLPGRARVARVRLKPDTTVRLFRLKPDTTVALIRLKPDAVICSVRLQADRQRRPTCLEAHGCACSS
jgi:hypothetical protein